MFEDEDDEYWYEEDYGELHSPDIYISQIGKRRLDRRKKIGTKHFWMARG